MGLEDYKDLVATTASLSTMIHMLSGTLICRDIHRKGTSDGFDPIPFIGGIGMGLLMLRYAIIVGDPAMINVNLFGIVTSILYVAVFYFYSQKRNDISLAIGKMLASVAILLLYAQFEDPNAIEFRWGILTTVVLLLLIASPLANLGEVLRTKSTEILPFPLILMGTIVSSQWLLYGFIIDNSFVIFQNIVGLALYIIQLSLFVVFPSKAADKHPEKKRE